MNQQRDWTEDFEHDNGQYFCKCCCCGEQFTGHKRRIICKVCATRYSMERVHELEASLAAWEGQEPVAVVGLSAEIYAGSTLHEMIKIAPHPEVMMFKPLPVGTALFTKPTKGEVK